MAHRITLHEYTIVFGEAVRVCRINECKSDYLKSSVNLKDKCFCSNFNQKMTKNMLDIGKYLEDCFEPKSQRQFTRLL